VIVFGADGVERRRWGGLDNPFKRPRGLAVAPDGSVWVADFLATTSWQFDPQGVLIGAITVTLQGQDIAPMDVDTDAQGEVYVATDFAVFRYRKGQQIGARFESPGARGVSAGPGPGLVATAQDDQLGFTGLRAWPDRRLPLAGTPETWGNPYAGLGDLVHPRRVSANSDGHVFLVDDWPRVQHWTNAGRPVEQFATDALGDVAAGLRGSVFTLTGRHLGYSASDGQSLWTWQPESAKPVTGDAWGWLTVVDGFAGDVAALDTSDQRLHVLDYSGSPLASWSVGSPTAFVAIGDVALAADRVFLLNRTSRRIEVRARATGAPIATWQVPGTPTRLDAGPDGSLYVLTREGWVWKKAADGSDQAWWSVSEDGTAGDLSAGEAGRVYVTFDDTSRIGVYAPDPTAPVPELPHFPDRCTLAHDKTASPARVAVGDPVSIHLAVTGTCPLADARSDILLLLDTSGSMLGPKLEAARTAALAFVGQLDYGLNQVGLITFSSTVTLVQPLTADPRTLIRLLPNIGDEGGTSMFGALAMADQEFATERARPGVRQVVVLLTDGMPTDGGDILGLAQQFRQQGRDLYAIGLGLDVARGFLRQLVGDPAFYFEAPSPYDLNRAYDTIARRVAASQLLGQVTVTDVLPDNMRFEPASAVPPASYDTASRILTWRLNNVASAGLNLRYRVRPAEIGHWPTNVRADAAYLDGVGFAGQLSFPVPEIDVVAPERWTVFLPVLMRQQCPEAHADVVLAFDTSASMREPGSGGGTKLDAAIYAGRVFISQLKLPQDRVAIVAFSGTATTVQPLTGDPAAAVTALDRLPSGSGTRLDLGLAAARAAVGPAQPGRVHAVVLLTDGRQSGGSENEVLSEAAATRNAGNDVYTVGLGGDADLALLAMVAGRPDHAFTAPSEADLAGIYRSIAGAIPCQGAARP
jgi:Mg-chelatase subunit ChlD